jgi:Uncharacterized protein conserved in bacteria (DUF2330)
MPAQKSLFKKSIFSLLLAILPTTLAQPANACGCGGYVDPNGSAYVSQEQVLLTWNGQTEQIVMSLGVLGSSEEAAIILPVPARATVELGDATLWDELEELTKPLVVVEKNYVNPFDMGLTVAAGAPEGGAPGSAPPVTVLSRQTLGPFDVATLAATDATALETWLADNGFSLSPGLAQAFEPYIAQDWVYIAVKLQPGSGDSISGTLDPLVVTFDTTELVYPMRGSANARDTTSVLLYVLADHRVEKEQDFGLSHTGFADWVEPALLTDSPTFAPFVGSKLFLTKFEETVHPEQVTNDFWFTYTQEDVISHDTITVYEDDYTLVYITYIGLGIFVLMVVAGMGVLIWRLVRQPPSNSTK